MSFRFLFWILMLLWLIFGLWNGWGNNVALGGHVLLFILFGLLGWKVFGQPIQPIIILAFTLLFTGCAAPEKRVIDVTGMTKDQVILETARVQLEENKVAARREENKAWWTGVAKSAGTLLVQVSADSLRNWLLSKQTGFKK